MDIASEQVIRLTMARGHSGRWLPLLWQGVRLEVKLGGSLEELLVGQLGLEEGFVQDRIRIVFLNGHPVDDLQAAFVEEAAQIALGAAAPGIIGIALQRQSAAAYLREDITYDNSRTATRQKKGWITVKLFNEIARAIGPMVLGRGFGIEAATLNGLLADPSGILHAQTNGKAGTIEQLRSQLAKCEQSGPALVFLQVHEEAS